MRLTFNKSQRFTVPGKLYQILADELADISLPDSDTEGIILNFRDPDYSISKGGFHPVELRLIQTSTDAGCEYQFVYITDFSFQGALYPKLAVDIDVCFIAEQVFTVYGGWLDKRSGDELKDLFLTNFISYVEMGVFKVEVTFF
jgi:hypothetical protein